MIAVRTPPIQTFQKAVRAALRGRAGIIKSVPDPQYGYRFRTRPGFLRAVRALGALCAALLAGCGNADNSAAPNNNNAGGNNNNGNTGGPTLTRQEFAYVVNADDNTVAQFKINSDGTLAPLTPATVSVAANSAQVLVTPNGQFAYVMAQNLNSGAAVVSQFKINADGTLAPLTPATVALGTLIIGQNNPLSGSNPLPQPTHVAIDPQGRFLYAPTASQILGFPISANGTLGASIIAATLASPVQSFALDPQGGLAYVGSQTQAGSAFLAPFKVNADGSFTRIAGQDAPIAGAASVPGVALDPDGRFLYASAVSAVDPNTGDTHTLLAQFRVNADGTLTLVKTTMPTLPTNITAGGAFDLQQVDLALAMFDFQPTFSANGSFVYLPTGSTRVLEEHVGSDGSLTPIASGTVLAGAAPIDVSLEPSGDFAYIANQDTSVSQYRVNSDGSLTSLTPTAVNTGHRPVSIATTAPTAAGKSVSLASRPHSAGK